MGCDDGREDEERIRKHVDGKRCWSQSMRKEQSLRPTLRQVNIKVWYTMTMSTWASKFLTRITGRLISALATPCNNPAWLTTAGHRTATRLEYCAFSFRLGCFIPLVWLALLVLFLPCHFPPSFYISHFLPLTFNLPFSSHHTTIEAATVSSHLDLNC